MKTWEYRKRLEAKLNCIVEKVLFLTWRLEKKFHTVATKGNFLKHNTTRWFHQVNLDISVLTRFLTVWPVLDCVQYHLSHTTVSWQEVLQELWALLQLLVLKVFDNCSFQEVKHLYRTGKSKINILVHKFKWPETGFREPQHISHLLLVTLDPCHWQQQGHTKRTQVS